jgi:alpha-amylase
VTDRLALCFGVHNHQPVGNFDDVVADAVTQAYHPFLARVGARPELRLTVHCTGSLLEWLRERAPATYDLLGTVAARGQVELLTGGFFEPILAILPDADKRGQIERLTQFLKAEFGVRPRGMWLAERVWEPHLPRALRDAGVEYVLVDDSHFALAGLEPDDLGGYYLTEEQGATLGVFPISQRLRYLIPFAEPAATVEHLRSRHGRVAALTVVDDGEKFGAWPGTHAHVYGQGWLDRFFDEVLAQPWLALRTFAEVVDATPARARVYLPSASYREMGEWALPTSAAVALAAAKRFLAQAPEGARVEASLRGGFWRHFLVKYPEVGDLYWKMLGLSDAVRTARRARPDDARVAAAELSLWRGQANDAYWHGVFGGCYLPHLRRAVKGALLEAERALAEAEPRAGATWRSADANGDGREEILVRTDALAVTLNPEQGGSITELGYLPRALDLGDVFGRRPEVYHAELGAGDHAGGRAVQSTAPVKEAGLERLLAYDEYRRASLLDTLVESAEAVDPLRPWGDAGTPLATARFRASTTPAEDGVAIALALERDDARGLRVDKRVIVRGSTVHATYRVARAAGAPVAGRWAVQWNLALTAGEAPGRYFTLPDRPHLATRGRTRDVSEVALVDEWAGVEARLRWSPGAELAWAPVETVSASEGGYERIFQGTALVLVWEGTAAPHHHAEEWDLWTELTIVPR